MATETHYVVDIRVQRVDKTVTTAGNYSTAKTETEREVTELSHIVISDKVLPYLLDKTGKHLALLGESKGE